MRYILNKEILEKSSSYIYIYIYIYIHSTEVIGTKDVPKPHQSLLLMTMCLE